MTEKKALNIVTPDGVVKIGVRVVGGDTMALAGKYSMSFIREMAAQLTPVIESAVSVSGLADSGLSLQVVFAPNTFMEHISDNVTYRRLLLLDGVSAPRDFWIKWTRLDGAVAFPMWAEVSTENILFELGEDVFQKIREKEYRYLLAENAGEYHDAMSRKNVTEWRDIIKRAVRRGELTKIEIEEEISPETIELEARLADILGRPFVKKEDTVPEFSVPEDDKFELAMQKAREVVEGTTLDEAAPAEPDYEPDATEDQEDFPQLSDEQAELDEITKMALEALQFSKQNEPAEDVPVSQTAYSENIFEIGYEEFSLTEEPAPVPDEEIIPDEEDEPEEEFEVEITVEEEENSEDPVIPEAPVAPAPAVNEEPVAPAPAVNEEPVATAPAYVYSEENIRAELEAKIRLEYENKARMRAEEELAELRRERERMKEENERLRLEAQMEQEKLRAEYERLYEQSRRAQAVRDAKEALRRAEEEKFREEIESQLRAEAMERERLAEAARLAMEERYRIQAEADRAMRAREEEMRAAEDLRRREEAKAHLEAARQAEIEKIRREAEEQRVAAMKAMPVMDDCKYTYTSKTVRLIFRRSVDPNITTRIHEIIKATLEYYGKDRVYLKIKASVPDSQTVCLEFVHIPMEEMQLLGNIIKILGNSGLGIAKAILE